MAPEPIGTADPGGKPNDGPESPLATLLGMATGQAEAVRKDVGRLLLYTPVVNPAEFDVAIAYLVRRLEENASSLSRISTSRDGGAR